MQRLWGTCLELNKCFRGEEKDTGGDRKKQSLKSLMGAQIESREKWVNS